RACSSLAALDVTSGRATGWNPHLSRDSSIEMIVLASGLVYASNGFARIGGRYRSDLAALNAATAKATRWAPNPDEHVRALAIVGDTIYAGGAFERIG